MPARTYRIGSHGDPHRPRAVTYFLLNPTDDPAVLTALHTAVDSHALLVVRLSPAGADLAAFCAAVLTALGMSHHHAADLLADYDTDTVLDALPARLCGHRIKALVIDCPHPLGTHALTRARRWCDHLNARLVLVSHAITHQPALTITLDTLLATTPRRPRQTTPGTLPWPVDCPPDALPTADFTTFRARCHTALPPTLAANVDDYYRHVHDRVRRALTTTPPDPTDTHDPPHPRLMTARPALTPTLARLIEALFDSLTAGDPPAAARLIALRAIQSAAFTHAATLISHTPPHPQTPHQTLRGSLTSARHHPYLDTILNPTHAVAALLYGHLETDSYLLSRLLGAALETATPPTITVGTLRLTLPEWSLPILRSLVCYLRHAAPSRRPRFLLTAHDSIPNPWEVVHAHWYTRKHGNRYYHPIDSPPVVPDGNFDSYFDTDRRTRSSHPLDLWLAHRHLTLHPTPLSASATPSPPPAIVKPRSPGDHPR